MSEFVQIVSDQEAVVKGCGRACSDMHPLTRPAIPGSPPTSLSALLREHPEIVFKPEWLEAMDAGETIH